MCLNRAKQAYANAQVRGKAVVLIQAFARMVPTRVSFLKTCSIKKKARAAAEEREKREKAEREEEKKIQILAREQEKQIQLALAAEKKRAEEEEALLLKKPSIVQRKKSMKTFQSQKSLKDMNTQEKQRESERLHHQALAARIISEAAQREQREFDQGNHDAASRAKVLLKYEDEIARKMAVYEARRQYWWDLQNQAKNELHQMWAQLKAWYQSPEVQQMISSVETSVRNAGAWMMGRVLGVKKDNQPASSFSSSANQYKKDIGKGVAKTQAMARRAKHRLNSELSNTEWFQRAKDIKAKVRGMDASQSVYQAHKRRTNANTVQKDFRMNLKEWNSPVKSGKGDVFCFS